MSSKIKPPTEKSHGFLYALLAVILIGVAVVAYIVVNHNKQEEAASKAAMDTVSMTVTVSDQGITLAGKNPAPDAKKADLYEDFSCPHCAELAEATDGFMKQAIESGKLTVTIRPLNFLDGTVGHSSRAVAATLAAAKSGDANVYWNLRKVLFDKQKDTYLNWKADDFAKAAEGFGANKATVEAIKKEADMTEAKKLAEADAKKLTEIAGKVSSPQVTFDNKVLELTNAEKNGFANWPQEIIDGKQRFQPAPAPAAPATAEGDKK